MAIIFALPLCQSFEITRIALEGNSCNFIMENTLKICRENLKNHENGIKIMSAVLENRYTLFD